MKTEYLECHCHSPEHTLTFHVWDDEKPPMLFVHVFLRPEPFYKRIWNGLKYIFGYQCQYGHFDEFILNPKDVDRFIEMLNSVKQ